MIAPASTYRRIRDIEERVFDLPWEALVVILIASGSLERLLDHVPEEEAAEVRRLLERGLDNTGNFRGHRLTDDERMYIVDRLQSMAPRS